MPTKHLSEVAWERVRETTYKCVINTREVVKEGDVLDYLIRKASDEMTDEDYENIAKKRNPPPK